jgi:hypothetical protein
MAAPESDSRSLMPAKIRLDESGSYGPLSDNLEQSAKDKKSGELECRSGG